MAKQTNAAGGDLFIVDNTDEHWKVKNYLRDWTEIAHRFDIATGYFEIGALLALDGQWQKLDKLRILMGNEVSKSTRDALLMGVREALDRSIEAEKESNDFLEGVPAIVEALQKQQIEGRVYHKKKFHAKAYITHAKQAVVGPSALVGSSNFTLPGLTKNVELNVQLRREVEVLQEWFEKHWDEASDITEDLLRVLERHTREYTPFEVYAKALQEYERRHEASADEWEQQDSKIYPLLAAYQRHGYHGLLKRARIYKGAFLCDGVGLGKTYIGLMLIERLVVKEKKAVVLFVPKAAREAVWQSRIRKYIPEVLGGFLSFRVYNHTDLLRKNKRVQFELQQMREQADVVLIDEAHHFRNTGVRGVDTEERRSRYWKMWDLCDGKQVFMLTATPVNNRMTDFQHMVELFSRHQPDYFNMAPLGIHSLQGHIRTLDKAIEQAAEKREAELGGGDSADEIGSDTDLLDAERVLRDDSLFQELVVQRSRAYVKKSLAEEASQVLFPEAAPPKVVPYSVKQTYGKLLQKVEDAFHKDKPLFSLAMYYPYDFYIGDKSKLEAKETAWAVGRQKQVVRLIRTSFLKRFESSVFAFRASCNTLMKKLLAFYLTHAEAPHDKERLDRWFGRNKDITGFDPRETQSLFDDLRRLELSEEDIVESEYFEDAASKKLDPAEFDIPGLLADTLGDLDTVIDFQRELEQFTPRQDKKLQAIIQLLRGHLSGLGDVVLQRHKVLIFTEFKDTARYLQEQLRLAGFDQLVEIDSDVTSDDRLDVIQAFAPYYNDSSSPQLAEKGRDETRILISTDVLSEGLNLQDATRLINYDLHWNPVRLMQRIGRIDRRLDPAIEHQIIADWPELEKVRGTVQYYNFLPPEELNDLLSLYKKVTHKTLRISKTFGIENGKLLRPDDDYDILRNFTRQCEGTETQSESLSLELQRLLKENPGLEQQLRQMPNRIFSGKEALAPDAQGVFFCYARPAQDIETGEWSVEAGDVKWYLYDLATEHILDDPFEIVRHIRSAPDTPRRCTIAQKTLSEIRKQLDTHIKNTYLKKVQAPVGVKAVLKAWMELN
jgi:superfamily II DNA or RNA helicase